MIERKKVWINKNIDRSRKNQKKIDQISNGFITYKGLVLKLVYEKSSFEGIAVEDNELKIFYSDELKSKKLIIEWLKLQANNFLRARLSFLSKRISIEFNSLTIKSYTARWGSCNIKGDIFLNWKLIMLPESVIDYVLIHELAHINVPNHSREFWKLVKKKDPNYCKNKRWLKDNGSSFILFRFEAKSFLFSASKEPRVLNSCVIFPFFPKNSVLIFCKSSLLLTQSIFALKIEFILSKSLI